MSQRSEPAMETRLKLFSLWTSILFCLTYSEYFALHRPAALEQRKAFGANPEFHLAALVVVAIPILMIFLSVALPDKYNRTLNIVAGLFFVLFATELVFGHVLVAAAFCMGAGASRSRVNVEKTWGSRRFSPSFGE